MEKMKVAIIGCGSIARAAHIPAYMDAEDAEIKYFCDIIPERAENAVKTYGCGIAVTDYHRILEDDEVTAISICTPNNVHPQISMDCIRAGKNVLCEKPAARTYEEVKEMRRVQHECGGVLNIGVVNRFNGAVGVIRDMIANGELGEIYHVYVSFRAHRSIPGLGGAFTQRAIAGGGVLIDWGVHFLDIVMYCLGDPVPRTVSGSAYCKLGANMKEYVYEDMWAGPPKYDGVYDVDDFVTGFIRTAGPTISLNGAWAQNLGADERYIDFLGTKGGIRLNYGNDFTFYTTKDGKLYEEKPAYPSTEMFHEEINAFLRCIRTGEKLPSHIDTVSITARLMQAIYDSSEQGKEIVLDDQD